MADIVNLNRFRKRKAAERDRAEAAANRVLHGRSKLDRAKSSQEAERDRRTLDAHRIDRPEDDGAL